MSVSELRSKSRLSRMPSGDYPTIRYPTIRTPKEWKKFTKFLSKNQADHFISFKVSSKPFVLKISKLPEECLVHIFSFLRIKDLLICEQVCEQWERAANDATLWKRFMIPVTEGTNTTSLNLKIIDPYTQLEKLIRNVLDQGPTSYRLFTIDPFSTIKVLVLPEKSVPPNHAGNTILKQVSVRWITGAPDQFHMPHHTAQPGKTTILGYTYPNNLHQVRLKASLLVVIFAITCLAVAIFKKESFNFYSP
ncbi:MAG: F-box protein [Parachlamydiaceae bacterium]